MDIKRKLLEAVRDIDISDIGEIALVDILVNKINSLEKMVEEQQGEYAREYQRLHDQQEALCKERQMILRDPMYGAYGEYYFSGTNSKFILYMRAGRIIDLVERKDNIDYVLQRLSPEQWERSVP